MQTNFLEYAASINETWECRVCLDYMEGEIFQCRLYIPVCFLAHKASPTRKYDMALPCWFCAYPLLKNQAMLMIYRFLRPQ